MTLVVHFNHPNASESTQSNYFSTLPLVHWLHARLGYWKWTGQA
jgi:hypothetical protein